MTSWSGRIRDTFAIVLIIFGAVFPSKLLAEVIRPGEPEIWSNLASGALMFKVGLIILGVCSLVLPRLPFWRLRQIEKADHSKPDHRIYLILLGVLLIAALVMRLIALNDGLWYDELLTLVNYARMSFGQIITTFESENQHFLFSIFAHASFLAFGESAWALRLPAVIFGVGSIAALYFLGRELTNSREALLAAALFTFSYHHVWFSQNARGYTGLLFWSILSSWFFVLGLRDPRLRTWVLYAASAALGVYTHLTMGFVIAGHGLIFLFLLVVKKKDQTAARWVDLLLAFGMTGLFVFILFSLVIPQVLDGLAGTISVVSTWKSPIWTILEIIRGLEVGFDGAIVAVGAMAFFGAGLYGYVRTRPILLGIFFLPPAIGAGIVIGAGHHLWPRFFFFAFGFAVLVVIRGAMMLGSWAAEVGARITRMPSARLSWLGSALAISLIAISASSIPYAYGPKQDYEGALTFVEQNRQPGDAVVTVSLTEFPYHSYYSTGWDHVTSLDQLNLIRSKSTRTWLLYTFEPVLESVHPDVLEDIKQHFEVIHEFPGTVGEGNIQVMRADAPATQETGMQTVP